METSMGSSSNNSLVTHRVNMIFWNADLKKNKIKIGFDIILRKHTKGLQLSSSEALYKILIVGEDLINKDVITSFYV